MPRYFLHLRDGTDVLLDPDGIELPEAKALEARVLQSARDTMSHDVKDGRLLLKYRIDAEDEAGQLVYSLPFTDALEIVPA